MELFKGRYQTQIPTLPTFFFEPPSFSQKMRYRIEILVTEIKDTKVRFYGTNFWKVQKKNFQFEKVSTIKTKIPL